MQTIFTVLDAKPIKGNHTKESLAPMLTEIIDEYTIGEKVHAVVRDGAMGATTNFAGLSSIWCWAHILNRVSIL